ncbi:phosphoglucomutase/phosphomannomutase family protein, partial [bacterium]|nr:phosphoglucomutase/phosphomannomutase family protein [bacterium]
MQQIKFGTSGWRGIISDDFTFENVKIVVQAIADFIKQTKTKNKGSLDSNLSVVIGYDTRFLSKEFAQKAAMVLAANNIRAYLSNRDVPTPVIAYYTCRQKMQGGINFTASHNPAE